MKFNKLIPEPSVSQFQKSLRKESKFDLISYQENQLIIEKVINYPVFVLQKRY